MHLRCGMKTHRRLQRAMRVHTTIGHIWDVIGRSKFRLEIAAYKYTLPQPEKAERKCRCPESTCSGNTADQNCSGYDSTVPSRGRREDAPILLHSQTTSSRSGLLTLNIRLERKPHSLGHYLFVT